MHIETFETLLKKAALSKKAFASLVGMNYHSIINWNRTNNIPPWVEPFLTLYIENKTFKEIKSLIKDSGLYD